MRALLEIDLATAQAELAAAKEQLAIVTAERDYLLTGVSDSEARTMRIELQKEKTP